MAAELRGQARAAADGADARSLLRALVEAKDPLHALAEGMEAAMRSSVEPWLSDIARVLKEDSDGSAAIEVTTQERVQAVAKVANLCYGTFRKALQAALNTRPLVDAVGEEALNEIKYEATIAATAHAKVESAVEWTPPSHEPKVQTTLEAMATAQKKAEEQLQQCSMAAGAGSEGAAAAEQLHTVFKLVDEEWMPYLAGRLNELRGEGGSKLLCGTLPAVVRSLVPKFEKIYRATGESVVSSTRAKSRRSTSSTQGRSPSSRRGTCASCSNARRAWSRTSGNSWRRSPRRPTGAASSSRPAACSGRRRRSRRWRAS